MLLLELQRDEVDEHDSGLGGPFQWQQVSVSGCHTFAIQFCGIVVNWVSIPLKMLEFKILFS